MRPLFIKSILASLSCRPLQKSLYLTACVILTMLLSACKDYYEEQSSYENNNSGQYYIKAQVTTDVSEMDVSTRSSNPTPDAPDGGEDGDGNEMGLENENNVKNLTVFLYNDKNEGKKLEEEAFYFDDMERISINNGGKTQTWESKSYRKTSLPILSTGYDVLVVTNAGDLRSRFAGKPYEDFANYLFTSVWESSEGVAGVSGERATTNCNAFVMTNEQIHTTMSQETQIESTITVDGKDKKTYTPHAGTIDDPVPVFAKVERVAARIEFHIDNSSNGDIGTFFGGQTDVVKFNTTLGGYVYPAVTADTKKLTDKNTKVSELASGYFVLTHVLPYNCLKESSYLLKRVYDGSTTTYLDKETTTGDKTGVANNYVIDPWTLSTDGHTTSLYSNPLGISVGDETEALIKAFDDDLWKTYKVSNFLDNDHKVIMRYRNETYEYEKNQWRDILTYTMENTTLDNSVEHATGLLFRGKYYTKEEWNDGSPKEGAGTDKVYRYYIRHSDPTNDFQATGIPSADKLKTATPMTFGIVRNNLYRVSIGKVIAPETKTEEPKLNIVLKVKPWTKYTHDEIEM